MIDKEESSKGCKVIKSCLHKPPLAYNILLEN